MNNTVKVAAIVSVLVFGGIIGAFFIMSTGDESTDVAKTPSSNLDDEGGPENPPPPRLPSDPGKTWDGSTAPRDALAISVEVRDRNRNRPLRAATVRVFKKSEADAAQNEIDDLWAQAPHSGDGRVNFALIAGTYEIRVQCPGYTGESRSLSLIAGKKDTTEVIFNLERGTSITGIVLDTGNNPIAGARVFAFKELSDPDADIEDILRKIVELDEYTNTVHSETTSDTDGRFQLDGLENFWYTVRAVAPGFTPGEVTEVRAPNAKPVEIVLRAGGVLAGTVRDSDGSPVADATVMAFSELEGAGLFEIIMSKARPPVEEYTTGADGAYRLQSLGAGVYNFLVTAPSHQEHRELKHRVREGDNESKDFTLYEGHVIEGFITGPEDEPVVGASVRANAIGVASGTPRDQIRIDMKDRDIKTDEEGRFRFDTLVDARYMLIVHHQDYESLQKKDIAPDGDPVRLRLGVGAQIFGQVVDTETGDPIPGASISASDVANIRKDTTTDQEGNYVLSGLGANRRPVNLWVKATGFAKQKKQVSVRKRMKYEENFELLQTGTVAGIVVDSSDNVLPGAFVEVRPTQDSGATLRVFGHGQSNSDGVFVIENVEPGESLQVRVKLQDYLETYSAVFAVESGGRQDVGRVVLQLGGAISGVVKNRDGSAINGVWIEARPEGGTDLTPGSSVQTDNGGRFALRGLKAGNYDLIAKANGYIETQIAGIEAREALENKGNEIVMESGGMLGGVVSSSNGTPIQGAEVIVHDFGDGIQERRLVTDGKGRFEFNNIVAKDNVELEVSHDDHDRYTEKSVKVGTSDLEITLKPLGSVVGIVLGPSGEPMDSFTVQPQPTKANRRAGKTRLRPKTFNPQDGRFEYRGIPDGVYSLFVRSLKFSAVTLDDVEIRAGEIVDVGEIQLSEGGTVNGTVVVAGTNEPVAGAKVRVTQGARAFVGKSTSVVTTGNDGSFAISGLKDQVISLEVSHRTYATQKMSGVDPRVASKSQSLRVELEAPGRIVGTVTDAGGQRAKGLTVYLVAKGRGGKNDSRNTDAEGVFDFLKVAPGSYTVRAHRFGKSGSQADVDVFAGDTVEVNLQLDE